MLNRLTIRGVVAALAVVLLGSVAAAQSVQNGVTVSPLTVESIGPDHGRLRFVSSDGVAVIADFRSMSMAPAPKGLIVEMIDGTITRPAMADPARRAPAPFSKFRFLLSIDDGQITVLPME